MIVLWFYTHIDVLLFSGYVLCADLVLLFCSPDDGWVCHFLYLFCVIHGMRMSGDFDSFTSVEHTLQTIQ